MWFVIKKPFFAAVLLAFVTSGCSRSLPLWQQDARMIVDRDRMHGAGQLLPEEFKSVEETLAQGDSLLRRDELEEAEDYFHLAWTKGKLLERNLAAAKLRLAEAARLKAEAEEREAERRRALEEEQRKLVREKAEAEAVPETRKKEEKTRQIKDKPLPAYHTVKRGETLPQIAAQPDVYNDHTLWPLLYRANRDQIRDPRHIWPGQVVRIPRNISREDIIEARRFGQDKPLR